MSGANASGARDYDDLRAIVLDKDEQRRLKDALRNTRHTERETKRRLGLEEPRLHRPGGSAASYVTDWDGGIGVYPQMVWDRVEEFGYRHLLPGELPDYRKMFNGDPRRPWRPSQLRITLRAIGVDYEDFLGLAPALPAHLDALIAEATSLYALPLGAGAAAELVPAEIDRQLRTMAELLAREKAELLLDPAIGHAGVTAVRQALAQARIAHAKATREAITAVRTPQPYQ